MKRLKLIVRLTATWQQRACVFGAGKARCYFMKKGSSAFVSCRSINVSSLRRLSSRMPAPHVHASQYECNSSKIRHGFIKVMRSAIGGFTFFGA